MSLLNVNKVDPATGTALEIGTSGDTITVPTGAGLTVTDEVKTNKISPATGTAFTMGDSGDTFTIPAGATITNSGTATGFGGTNSPSWEVGLSTNQSIPNAAATTIGFTVLREGTSATYWDTTNFKTQNLTAGKYFVWIHLSMEATVGSSTCYIQIKRFNSSNVEQAAITDAGAQIEISSPGISAQGIFNVATGDYFKYTMYQNSGGATDAIYESGDGATSSAGGFKLVE